MSDLSSHQRSWPNPVRPRLLRDLHRRVTDFLSEEGVIRLPVRRTRPPTERAILADQLLKTISPEVLKSAGYTLPHKSRPRTRWKASAAIGRKWRNNQRAEVKNRLPGSSFLY